MKNFNLFTLLGIVVGSTLFLSSSGGMDSNYAAAPGDSGDCSSCHSGGTSGGNVTLFGLPAAYNPNGVYVLTVKITDADAVKGGFQIVATDGSSNDMVGSFSAPAGTRLASGTDRLIHSTPKNFSSGTVSWSFTWTAPGVGGPSDVVFYYAGNSVDGTGGTDNDFVYINNSTVAVLPIELADFQAKPNKNGSVDLFWKTYSESNNDHFTIEKRINEGDFESIGDLRGMGTTTEQHEYNFSDPIRENGLQTIQYRLKQTDFDGKCTYSKVVSLEIGKPTQLSVWPNLARSGENIHVGLAGFESLGQLEILSFSGKKMFSQSLSDATDQVSVSTDGWASGQYIVKISGNNSVSSMPLIVF